MELQLINPTELAPAVGFAHIAVADGWVVIGGQISTDSEGKVVHAGDLVGQFRQAIGNVALALAAAGCRPEDAVKLTYFVTDVPVYRANRVEIGVAYRHVFGRHYPASSLFGVTELFEPDALVEIECVARRGPTS